MKTVHEIVRAAEANYLTGTVKLGRYVDWSMHDTIETIDAYLNSKHISGPKDALGRDKPFFNIVTAITNIWYRATDIDRKNIRVMPSSSDTVVLAFLTTVLLQRWMRKARFGVFLNEWGRSLARYGSSVTKFIEKGKDLNASVLPWNRVIPDPIDFDAIPHIEKFYKTPEQLRSMKGYDQSQVDNLISAIQNRKTLDGDSQDAQSGFVELYEVHGNLPTYLLKDDPKPVEDKDVKYSQQMHVVSYVKNDKGDYDDFTLYRGKESRDPYMLTHLIKEDGRTLSIGGVEYAFEAQWMENHTMKNVKDTLDLTSRVIFQTADPTIVGRNVLNSIETGSILIRSTADKDGITQVNNSKPDVAQFLNFGLQWRQMAQELTSTPDAIRGNTLPSGTPYSLAAYQGAQASSLFEMMTENKGLAIEDMLNTFVLPFIRKQMDNKDEVVAILDEQGVAEIDAMWVPKEAIRQYNAKAKAAVLAGNIPAPYQADVAEADVRKQLGALGNKRIFKPDDLNEKTWKHILDEFFDEAEVVVEITNENTDKQAVLTTLASLFQTVAVNPAMLQDPNARMLFNRILIETGELSPIQLSASAAQPTPPTALPAPTVAPPAAAPLQALNAPNGI